MTRITVEVDGVIYQDDVEPRLLLVHYLRERVGKTGTPIGCDTSNCGACTVHLDGVSVKSCSVLAVQADGSDVTTIEGMANCERHPLQQAFHSEHALQCGYCTPGRSWPPPTCCARPRSERPGDPRGPGGQPLPVHRLREHRPRGTPRGRDGSDVMTTETQAQSTQAVPSSAGPGCARKTPPGHRADHLDRQPHPARHAAHRVRAQPLAHAKITRVDVSRALQSPGVIAAFSGAYFADEQGSLPAPGRSPRTSSFPHTADGHRGGPLRRRGSGLRGGPGPLRRRGRARSRRRDYGRCCRCWTSGPHWTSPRPVQRPGTRASSGCSATAISTPRSPRPGDPPAELPPAAADPQRHGTARGGLQLRGRGVHPWSATQIPHVLRVMLALVTGIPEQNIRVIAPDVGGGFGSKLQVCAEEVLALLIARSWACGKWTESRSEGNMTVHHGRDQWQRIKVAAERDGRLRGLSVDLLADMGAYLMLVTPGVPLLGVFMFNSIYKMDALSFRCTGVFTTKMPTDAYRGAGRPEATFGIERIMEDLAAELGIEPLGWASGTGSSTRIPVHHDRRSDLRQRQLRGGDGQAKELFRYDELRVEQEQRRDSHDPVQLGIGISTYTEMCWLVRPGCSALWPTGQAAGSTPRSGCCRRQGRGGHRGQRARAGSRNRVEPDRRGQARCPVRGHPGAARRHPGLPEGHGHLRVPSLTVGGVAVHGAARKSSSRPRRSPRPCWRCRPRRSSSRRASSASGQ